MRAHSYATEQNGIPDKYLLTVSVHKAYEELKKFFHTLDGELSEYFISEDIEKGTRWRETIAERLNLANFLVFVFTDPDEDWEWSLYETVFLMR